jgi:hypothetical protein
MNKRLPGRAPHPKRADRIITLVKLTQKQRRILRDDFGSFQNALEQLAEHYIENRDTVALPQLGERDVAV